MQFNPRQKRTDGRPSCAIYSRALDEEGPHGIVSGGPLASLPGLLAQAGQGGLRWEGGGGCEGPTCTPPPPLQQH